MIERKDLWKLVLVVGLSAIPAGFIGMVLSLIYLDSSNLADVTAGASGLVAGAVLAGSGMIACSVIAASGSHGFDGRSPADSTRKKSGNGA